MPNNLTARTKGGHMEEHDSVFDRISREVDIFFAHSAQRFLYPVSKMMQNEKYEIHLMPGIQSRILGVLALLSPGESLSVKELSAQCRTRKSEISPALYVLEEKGYVSLETSRIDRRVKLVRITPEGKRLCDEGDQRIIQISREYFKIFCTDEQLEKLADNLHEVNKFWKSLDPERYFLTTEETDKQTVAGIAPSMGISVFSTMRQR